MRPEPPLLTHALDAPSLLTPEDLMSAVRAARPRTAEAMPEACVLDFDGDLTDLLVRGGRASRHDAWACFHTSMHLVDAGGAQLGIIDRTIGGPYTVLVAEQLHAAGVRHVIGLASAGRVRRDLALPCLVVADEAVRDEGTSLHYLPPSERVACPASSWPRTLATVLQQTGVPVLTGAVWTTDAPYRETAAQMAQWEQRGVLAVEMQAASLFAYGQARQREVALIAIVSNGPGDAPDFDTGGTDLPLAVLEAIGLVVTRLRDV